MLKVLYVIDSLQTGGAEKSLLDITSRLTSCKPVVCHIYENSFLLPEFERLGVSVISLGIKGPYNFAKAARALKEVLKKERPDVVVATLLRSELISRWVCRQLKIPNVGTFVNDTYSPYEWQALSRSMQIKIGFFWILNALTARWCIAFLSNSQSIKNSNCRALCIPAQKVHVIYRGRRTDVFEFKERQIDVAAPHLLAVGRLLYRKGFEELLTAFRAYLSYYPQATLTIAGEGPYRKQLEKTLEEYQLKDRVQLVGNRSDIPALMHDHDIFVFPSHYEGFSGTLVEAMLAGIPIVASDISMNKEAVEHEVTARLFHVQNASALLDQLRAATIQIEKSASMAHQARLEAASRFDISAIAAQHEAFYISVVKNENTSNH